MTRTITLCLLLAATGVAAAAPPIYVWTDEQGIRHYSDRATHGATRRATPAIRALSDVSPEPTDAPASRTAHTPRIISPVDGSTLAPGQREVMIAVGLSGGLGPNERLVYRLDGRELDAIPPRATRLAVDRLGVGRHELDVTLMAHDTSTGRRDRVVFDVAPASGSSTPQPNARPPS